MDERMKNLNLAEILKDCPTGTKLYSPIYGDVELVKVHHDRRNHPIEIKIRNYEFDSFSKDGRIFTEYDGECMLFPSKDQRDWSKFKYKKPKFGPNNLQPFDKVLVRDSDENWWRCAIYSHRNETNKYFITSDTIYKYCIPYNSDTEHLVGTTDEAPEYYRYWED